MAESSYGYESYKEAYRHGIEEGEKASEAKIKRLTCYLKDCRNELCLKCGLYREKHLGRCDGCRWKEVQY